MYILYTYTLCTMFSVHVYTLYNVFCTDLLFVQCCSHSHFAQCILYTFTLCTIYSVHIHTLHSVFCTHLKFAQCIYLNAEYTEQFIWYTCILCTVYSAHMYTLYREFCVNGVKRPFTLIVQITSLNDVRKRKLCYTHDQLNPQNRELQTVSMESGRFCTSICLHITLVNLCTV